MQPWPFLLLLFLAACMAFEPYAPVPTGPPIIPGQCFDNPEGQAYVEDIILRQFQLRPGTYELVNTSCDLGRGGNLQATVALEGAQYALRYDWGRCGSVDCGWSSCIVAPQGVRYQEMKTVQCAQVTQRQADVLPNDACGEIVDRTPEARKECLRFEEERDGLMIFSLVQASLRCSQFAVKGPVPCA